MPVNIQASTDGSKDSQHVIEEARKIVESEPEKVIILLKETLQNLDEKKDAPACSAINSLLGDAYYYADDLELSLAHYQKSAEINILTANEHSVEQMTVLGNIGYIYDVQEQYMIALDYYNQALKLARQLGDKEEIATNLANIGKIQTIQGFYIDALRNMEEALALDREAGDESMVAIDLNTIGRIYEAWGEFDKAAEYLKKALAIDLKLNQMDKVAIRYSGLGLVCKAWGKYELALEYFDKAMAIDKELKNNDKIALRQVNIGSTYLAMGNPDKALSYLDLGLAYFEKNQMTSYHAATLIDIGKCHLIHREYQEAESAFLKSIELSRPGKLNRNIMNSLEQLSKLYQQMRQFEKAYQSQTGFMTLKDSLFNAESQKIIMEFQALYELDNKQQQLELLVRDQELARKRHANTRLLVFVFSLVFVVIVLALLVMLKNLQNKRLQTEKENEALKSELDQRNKELTFNAMCIVKNNETMVRMVEAVDSALEANDEHHQLKNVIHQLQRMEQDKSWEDFEIRFIQTHQDFYKKLQSRFPDLTPNERKLCAFLRLNLSTKDIATITHQSINSINVARTRLRKKLSIDGTDENLIGFLHSL